MYLALQTRRARQGFAKAIVAAQILIEPEPVIFASKIINGVAMNCVGHFVILFSSCFGVSTHNIMPERRALHPPGPFTTYLDPALVTVQASTAISFCRVRAV